MPLRNEPWLRAPTEVVTSERAQGGYALQRQGVGAVTPAPGDAVLTTSTFKGTLVLLPDGTFAGGSMLSADLDTLKSDSDLRDEGIKINTLNTRISRARRSLQLA